MKLILLLKILFSFLSSEAYAYKIYSYNTNGNRVYKEITPEIAHKNKSRKRYAHIRKPRESWEITPEMRKRKKTLSQFARGQ